ncbi:MAG: translation initiation factor IF-2 [bacterium]|nr:translation initiation factor IF-2 [bacterium]
MTQTRPPIVAILGHVDHGKTTLLSAIRNTRMPKEAGNITQGIGAFSVPDAKGKRITFLDTPGHEAFSKMRRRGVDVADIAILVVAADDGVNVQTKEAIVHIHAAKTPMIVAINKMDLPTAQPDRVKQGLAENGVLVEGYGGDVVTVPVSATKGTGIDDLLEMIHLVAEMQELKADPKALFAGVIIESRLDPHRGPLATVLVKEGTLQKGMTIYASDTKGKVRSLVDANDTSIDAANPSTPVEVLGFTDVPPVGALVTTTSSGARVTVPTGMRKRTIKERLQGYDEKTLRFIIKTDVFGSVEALRESLVSRGTDEHPIEIIHAAPGPITESDIFLAKSTGARLLGFRVPKSTTLKRLADDEGVQVETGDIIYKLLEYVDALIKGVGTAQTVRGKATIVKVFRGTSVIAGVRVEHGVFRVHDTVQILQGVNVQGVTKIASMRHLKESIKSCAAPNECGLIFTSALDFKEGDAVQLT